MRKGKRFEKMLELLKDKVQPMSVEDAVKILKQFNTAKFDQSVECVMSLGIDSKQADQLVRGSLSLPKGIGKSFKVIAFCESDVAEKAKAAGAIEAGADDFAVPDDDAGASCPLAGRTLCDSCGFEHKIFVFTSHFFLG
jgi:large subunit ribosomal protein L1